MHNNNCECNNSIHIWDDNYDQQVKSERFCLCCEHYFLSEDAEELATTAAIELPSQTSKDKKIPGIKKGVIRRRS